ALLLLVLLLVPLLLVLRVLVLLLALVPPDGARGHHRVGVDQRIPRLRGRHRELVHLTRALPVLRHEQQLDLHGLVVLRARTTRDVHPLDAVPERLVGIPALRLQRRAEALPRRRRVPRHQRVVPRHRGLHLGTRRLRRGRRRGRRTAGRRGTRSEEHTSELQ